MGFEDKVSNDLYSQEMFLKIKCEFQVLKSNQQYGLQNARIGLKPTNSLNVYVLWGKKKVISNRKGWCGKVTNNYYRNLSPKYIARHITHMVKNNPKTHVSAAVKKVHVLFEL